MSPLRVNKWIEIRLLSSLAEILPLAYRMPLSPGLVPRLSNPTNPTLDYLCWLVSQRRTHLLSWNINLHPNLRVGRKSSYQMWGRKSWLRQSHKPFLHILWVASRSPTGFVMRWLEWWDNFGRDRWRMRRRWLGWAGNECASQKIKGGWVLETWSLSFLPY